MDDGCKRAVLTWHRRAGKDKTCLNFLIKKMFERVGLYFYYFPTLADARKAVWDAIDSDGFPVLGHFPEDAIQKTNDQEMKVVLKNGSIFQLMGTDRLTVVGHNPVGCVFSEYSLQNPKGWDYVRPILRENKGWAVFNFTPRGKNHAYDLYRMAKNNEIWFCQKLTIDETDVLTEEDMEAERKEGMSEDMILQEYYCSFELGVEGSYYFKYMNQALQEGRIKCVPYDESTPVFTFWDLGISDATAIWFAQFVGKEIHLIDYYENIGESIAHYVKLVKEKPYMYSQHFAPHDVVARNLATGISTFDRAAQLGINFEIIPRTSNVNEGIEASRSILRQCWFDEYKCKRGIDCLENYRKNYNEKTRVYSTKPRHDEFSNGADAFRQLAVAYRQGMINSDAVILATRPAILGPRAKTEYDVLNFI